MIQEPIYDLERLQTDTAYRYSMVAAFTDYMESLPDYSEQLCYYIRICKAMAIAPSMGGSNILYDGEYWSGYGEGKPVDKQGNALNSISWGVPSQSRDDKSIRLKTYFIEFYKDLYDSLLDLKIRTKSELTAGYLQKVATSVNPEALKNSELRTIIRTIEQYQVKITQWANRLNVPLPIREQFIQASQLVEDELNGSDAIDWSLFYSPSHLDPFAVLWGLIEFKLILEIGGLIAPAQLPTLTSDETKSSARVSEPGFVTYINEQYGAKLMPYLSERYKDRKAKDIVPMLYALEHLRILKGKIMNYDQTELHRELVATFGKVGARTSINDALREYHQDPAKPNPNREQKINKHRQQIEAYLKSRKIE